ncbi:MAG: NAD-dependent epimerase/dehydratase family protein [Deltaproteobacteria bacterium]|nr:NAD-dependent epimerase/dehydratase family protein [Deltaproteobacteria bacterium]
MPLHLSVLVIGAAGHVGGNLVRSLLAAGRKVRAAVFRDERALAGLGVERVKLDVLDPASLAAALRGTEVVYHLAAIIAIAGEPERRVEDVNVRGPRNVAQACLAAGVRRLVHFSSIHAFQQLPLDQPLDETRGPAAGPGTLTYDRTKAAGEREILAVVACGLDAVIVNPTAILGPHDYKPGPLGEVLLRLGLGTMPALVEAGFDFVDVRDVVAGALAAEERGRRGERYLLPGRFATFRELGQIVAAASGRRPPRLVSPLWLARVGAPFLGAWCTITGGRPLYTSDSLRILRQSHPDIRGDKAARELGFRARPLGETVRDTWAWFRAAGMA